MAQSQGPGTGPAQPPGDSQHRPFNAVVLAAGAGTRFSRSGGSTYKQVVPYRGVPVIRRIVDLLHDSELIGQVHVVLGSDAHCAGAIREALADCPVLYHHNELSRRDNNLLSVETAVRHLHGPAVIVEADCVFEARDLERVLHATGDEDICWGNIGPVDPFPSGGVLATTSTGKVEALHILDAEEMAAFKRARTGLKLFGIAAFGSRALAKYRTLAARHRPREFQYFHAVAMNHPGAFSHRTVAMSPQAFSFNTTGELQE